jgi:hypothetical protein
MVRKRVCQLCGANIGQNVAAHDCPHGVPCTYRCGPDGLPIDWRTPACGDCCQKGPMLRALPDMQLTDKAWKL